jgi:hypothetical protein
MIGRLEEPMGEMNILLGFFLGSGTWSTRIPEIKP